MKKNQRIILVAIISLVLIIASLVCLAFLDKWFAGDDVSSNKTAEEIQNDLKAITVNGVEYIPKNVKTLLVVGLDGNDEQTSSGGYRNNRQADFLMLISFNKDDQKASVVIINRDTYTDVETFGVAGTSMGKRKMQIALAHTYGDGTRKSLDNTQRAVSDLFGGLWIDYCFSINMSAISDLNDYIAPEGVSLTIGEDDDLSEINESWTAGSNVILNGDDAQKYVRARQNTTDGTNVSRMERQKNYMKALYRSMPDRSLITESWVKDGFDAVQNDLYFNWSASEFNEIVSLLSTYEFTENIVSPEGNAEYSEDTEAPVKFFAYEDSINNILITYFYKERYAKANS